MSTKYIIVMPHNDSVFELVDMVNEKINEGYEPQGGVSMTFVGGKNWIDARPMQAMVKSNE